MKRKSLLAIGIAALLVGCTTTKTQSVSPTGTTNNVTTTQFDTQAAATGTAILIDLLSQPAVSNAIYQATQGK